MPHCNCSLANNNVGGVLLTHGPTGRRRRIRKTKEEKKTKEKNLILL